MLGPRVLSAFVLPDRVRLFHSASSAYLDVRSCVRLCHHGLCGDFDGGVYGGDDPGRDYGFDRVCARFGFALSQLPALSRSLPAPLCVYITIADDVPPTS